MSLRDAFRPKWRSSHEEVRLEAVRTLDDEAVLLEIVDADLAEAVRREAFDRLQGLSEPAQVNARLAAENPFADVRRLALTTLVAGMNADLKKTEESERRKDARAFAGKLIALAMRASDPEVARKCREAAAEFELSAAEDDEQELIRLALHAESEETRRVALRRLTTQSALEAVVSDGEGAFAIRLEALFRLHDEGVFRRWLDQILLPLPPCIDAFVRALLANPAAVQRCFGGRLDTSRPRGPEDILAALATLAANPEVRSMAFGMIQSPTALAQIAEQAPDHSLRDQALSKLDQRTLIELAKHAESIESRAAAVARIDDQLVLLRIARNPGPSRVRVVAACRIISEGALITLASADPDAEVRSAAQQALDLARAGGPGRGGSGGGQAIGLKP